MAKFPVPKQPERKSERFDGFRGVDFSTDPTQVSSKRSPWALNMISDSGGHPEKRVGWRTLATADGAINGIFHCELSGVGKFLVHAGTMLYEWNMETNVLIALKSGIANAKSTCFVMNGKAYILTGSEFLVYDGTDVKSVSEIAYVPTTSISMNPAGGGTTYEEINLIQPKRKNSFLADGVSKVYQLDTTEITDVLEVIVNGNTVTEYTVDTSLGRLTFTTAPAKPAIDGQDNVFITFSKTVSGYADRICKCTIATIYGGAGSDRVFLSGNPEMKSTDWVCSLNNPTYWPDFGYTNIGADGTAIVGYARIGDYLAIFKEDNQQDSTIYLRYVLQNSSTGKTAFAVKQGISGVGALAKRAFGYLLDEPLFVSRTGIYALTSNEITYTQAVRNRSYFVDAKLTKEPNLKDAIAAVWKGYYVLCVDGRCYILDGNQNKAYKPQSYGEYVYECYYWDNIPAQCFMVWQGHLFFGTEDGKVCRFSDDRETMDRYSDDGEAIAAEWRSKATDHGDFMRLKTLVKKGSGMMAKPYVRSSVEVIIRTDQDWGKTARVENMSAFDFNDVDYDKFSFVTNDSPQMIPFNSKTKKYSTIQIIVRNTEKDEGFGVFGIILRYTAGNYVK
ncbi:MAG: hypothetical protein J6N18_10605 [Kiritimatiellae bacterium]|nr:hypothetical protein [Kiritimatiellia bacterium]